MEFESSLADELIAQSRRELDREESAIEALAAVAAFDYVALYAQAAAQRAAYRHAGVFASAAIDRALLAAASSLDAVAIRQSADSALGILHIATETPSPEGGHSRMIERWIRSDSNRRHSLALTSPRREVPIELAEAITAAGGAIHVLAIGSCSFMARAAGLRQLAAQFDAVVLHTHPYDVVPTIALATPQRPPCIAFNMAGHLFWIGTRIADVVASGRSSAIEIGIERRGITPEASHLLPVIAQSRVSHSDAANQSRDHLRRTMNINPDDLVFVTVASAYKLDPLDSNDLAAMVLEVVAQRPSVRWLVVGIPPDGRFAKLVAQTERVSCFPPTHDIDVIYSVADAYLDSHPFTSQTSLLDAAASELPLVALQGHTPDASILSSWGSTLDQALMGFSDAIGLVRVVDVLTNATERRLLGIRAKAAVGSQTVGSAWASRIDPLFARARERTTHRHPNGEVPVVVPSMESTGLDRYLALLNRGSEPSRVFLNWQRSITNHDAIEWFPGAADRLGAMPGLAGVVGQLEVSLRDQEERFRQITEANSSST